MITYAGQYKIRAVSTIHSMSSLDINLYAFIYTATKCNHVINNFTPLPHVDIIEKF